MFRRTVSMIALFGYLITQAAAVPHAHLRGFHHDHDCEPHFHLAWFAGGYGEDEHDDDRNDDLAADFDHSELHIFADSDGEAHDHDAVYLLNCLGSERVTNELFVADLKWTPVTVLWSSTASAAPSGEFCWFTHYWRSFDSTGDHCALFLKLRTLRI